VSAGEGPDVAQGARPEPTGKGRVVVLSGPSAVGKSTVVRCLRERIPNLQFSVSATTRAPRPGEVDGVDYHFVTPARFQELIDGGALLEWAEIHGGLHRSGTLAEPVRAATEAGLPVLIEVDLAGARAVKKAMPEATTVFLAPPSWEDLQARLVGRGTETPEAIRRRLDTARVEMAAQDDFDEVVVNSRLESACAELVSLLVGTAPGTAQTARTDIGQAAATPDSIDSNPPGDRPT
jgi:guanylate kinase